MALGEFGEVFLKASLYLFRCCRGSPSKKGCSQILSLHRDLDQTGEHLLEGVNEILVQLIW